MKHILYLENLRKDLYEKELIKTFNSERYGDYIEFTERLNMNYVDKYEVLKGEEKDNYINKYIKRLITKNIEYMEEVTILFIEQIKDASNFIDITPYLDRVKNEF